MCLSLVSGTMKELCQCGSSQLRTDSLMVVSNKGDVEALCNAED